MRRIDKAKLYCLIKPCALESSSQFAAFHFRGLILAGMFEGGNSEAILS